MENTIKEIEKVIDRIGEITISVDYIKSIEHLIEDGDYHCVDSNITSENFTILPDMVGKKVEVSTKLFIFDYDAHYSDIVLKMDQAGYRAASLRELLIWGVSRPELVIRLNIFALGSMFGVVFASAPCLIVGGPWRDCIDLIWFTNSLKFHPVFLAVRK